MKSFPYHQRVTRDRLTELVELSIGDFAGEFDIAAIVAAIVDTYGIVHIDAIPVDDYWALVRRFDRGNE